MLNNTLISNYKNKLSNQAELISDLSNLSMDDIFGYIKKDSIDGLNYYWLGRRDYNKTWSLQRQIQDEIKNNNLNDIILFLEHNPIYTLGKNADESNLLPTKDFDIDVIKTDRGGDVTCHAPGQLIGYPIIDLKRYNKSISWFMKSLEESIILMLKELNIIANRKDGLTGVWVDDNKIAALGVRLSKWVSMHGFAINVYTDLKLFRGIIPCGIVDFGLTSILKIKNKEYELLDIAKLMTTSLSQTLINTGKV
tara:strand:+ start:8084 stop:8839 length:756 start_codon:yes stop_codon:yes gene_type:complete